MIIEMKVLLSSLYFHSELSEAIHNQKNNIYRKNRVKNQKTKKANEKLISKLSPLQAKYLLLILKHMKCLHFLQVFFISSKKILTIFCIDQSLEISFILLLEI